MIETIQLPIIGDMYSPYTEKFGIPRQPNLVDIESYIEMRHPYNDVLAFEGIEEFSHLWLIWQFHDNKHRDAEHFRPQVRPPRLGGNQKIGVFATRSMYRPAPIGLSVVQFLRLECNGSQLRIYVKGSDLLNQTPILDIKPYIVYSDAIIDAQSGYAQEEPTRKTVHWSSAIDPIRLERFQFRTALEQVLSLDPRPAYQEDPTRIYKMKFSDVDVSFQVNEHEVWIMDIQ